MNKVISLVRVKCGRSLIKIKPIKYELNKILNIVLLKFIEHVKKYYKKKDAIVFVK